jgi:acyl-CoA thioester hydrolase
MNTKKILEPSSLDKIRFTDCDPFGHLNNSRYLDYIINARENHLLEFYELSLDEYYKKGIAWVVAGHEIAYLRPARFNEIICIQTSLISATDNALQVEGIMFDEYKKSIKAVLWTKFTCIDLKTGKKQNHNSELMEFAERVLNTQIDPSVGLTKRLKSLSEIVNSQ